MLQQPRTNIIEPFTRERVTTELKWGLFIDRKQITYRAQVEYFWRFGFFLVFHQISLLLGHIRAPQIKKHRT